MRKIQENSDLPFGIACQICDLFTELSPTGLCEDCQAKLERDLIRARDWDASVLGLDVSNTEREGLRLKIIREYGLANELLGKYKNKKPKTLEHIQTKVIHNNYVLEDVLATIEDWLSSSEYIYHDLQEIGEKITLHFQGFKPKSYGYKNLLHLLRAHPKRFQIIYENPKNKYNRGQIYICLNKSSVPSDLRK